MSFWPPFKRKRAGADLPIFITIYTNPGDTFFYSIIFGFSVAKGTVTIANLRFLVIQNCFRDGVNVLLINNYNTQDPISAEGHKQI